MLNKLVSQMMETPQLFNFYQAVRIIERTTASCSIKESIDFKVTPSLSFPVSDIDQFTMSFGEHPHFEMWISFLGLIGGAGILPNHLKETMLRQLNQKDGSMVGFLNIFHQAIIPLFYETWKNGRYEVIYENYCHQEAPEEFLSTLYGLTGSGHIDRAFGSIKKYSRHDSGSLCFESHLFYSGLFSIRARPREALKILLEDYFQLPIKINNFIPERIAINHQEFSMLSKNRQQYNALGVDAVVGRHLWYSQNHFEIEIRSLDYDTYRRLLPHGQLLTSLTKMVREFIGNEFDYHLTLIISKREIPVWKLNCQDKKGLGWDTWLKFSTQKHGVSCEEEQENFRIRLYKRSVTTILH